MQTGTAGCVPWLEVSIRNVSGGARQSRNSAASSSLYIAAGACGIRSSPACGEGSAAPKQQRSPSPALHVLQHVRTQSALFSLRRKKSPCAPTDCAVGALHRAVLGIRKPWVRVAIEILKARRQVFAGGRIVCMYSSGSVFPDFSHDEPQFRIDVAAGRLWQHTDKCVPVPLGGGPFPQFLFRAAVLRCF